MHVDDRITSSLAGRYTVERELGRGGMATVFLARDVRHRRPVAVKVLRPDIASAVGADRFLFEVETASRLTHPHILPLLDSGDADGLLYYVMPYAEGESLRDRLGRERQLPVADAVRIACEVASALDYAHRCDIVHRDIKPENILLEDGQAVVADFGIARAISRAGEDPAASVVHAGRTATGVALGTPAYMSPEQAAADQAIDGRSDIYALGCVLYEMLAGEPPFTGTTAESVVRQHLTVTAPAVTTVRPAVPPAVAAALSRALEKTPADRFATAAGFAEALPVGAEGKAERAAAARNAGPEPAAGRRRWAVLGVTGLLVFGAATAGAWAMRDRFGAPISNAAVVPAKPSWTIVAGVEGTADAADRAAARTLITTALDQSNVVVALPDDQLRLGLASAGKEDVLPLDATTARELAIRGGVRTVVAPTVDRVGEKYHVSIQLISADSGTVIVSERAIARDVDNLIPTIDRVAMAVRRRVGEKPAAVAASRPLGWVATPSFEAYRLFRQADELQARRENHAAVPLYMEALAIDPDFATAWLGLGIVLFNSVSHDSAAWAWEQGLMRPERLRITQRLNATAMLAYVRGDHGAAVEAYRTLHHIAGRPVTANNLAVVLTRLDRTEEAVDLILAEERDAPFGLSPLGRGNLALWLAALGRFPEAREKVAGLGGDMQARVAIHQGAWAEAESLATAVLDTLTGAPLRAALLAGILGSTSAASGRVHDAFDHLRERRRYLTELRNWPRMRNIAYDLLALSLASGVPLSVADTRLVKQDSTTRGRSAAALVAAVLGDTADAVAVLRLSVDSAVSSSPTDLRQGGRALVQAAVASTRGDAAGVVKALAPLAPQAKTELNPGSHVAYWMLADAYDKIGQRDSATIWFDALIDVTRIASEDLGQYGFGLTHSFAHFRLARIHAARGDHADSRKHATAFLDAFRQPDPEFKWMVAEAQRLAGEN